MKSPFPGMDPYLERHWLDVHASFAVYAREQLQVQMPPDLIVRVEEYMSVSSRKKKRQFSPDVRIHDRGAGKKQGRRSSGSLAVAEPLLVPLEIEPATLRRLRILDTQSGERIVTAIEFLSPANKNNRAGRLQYLKKRKSLFEAGANLVEIDLIREGGEVMPVDLDDIPLDYREPYRIYVLRNSEDRQAELYHASFKERLPTIRIPLREKDKDAILDIQKLVDRSYEGGRYGRTIDYAKNPSPPLLFEDGAWADKLLRSKRLR